LDINKLSNIVIGAAIEVHKSLGPGLLESTYEQCLCYELKDRNLSYGQQIELPISYKGKKLDCGYRVDIMVENSIILELKAVDKIEAIHKAQLLTYLKLSEKTLGLILNFNVELMRNGIMRIVNKFKE